MANGQEDFECFASRDTVVFQFNRDDGSTQAVRLTIEAAKVKLDQRRKTLINVKENELGTTVYVVEDIQKIEAAIKEAENYKPGDNDNGS